MSQILEQIENPGQLKRLSIPQLEKLAMELRALMIESVSKTGGHLAPSLGTVDLTLALYSVFDAAEDTVVWDVGHQAYAHKILTGRRERFGTLRQKDGITGFPKRAESPYDAFGTGHAKIKDIIENHVIETQEELADALRKQHIEVTQATVSRDIKELMLVKVPSGDGRYRYAYPLEKSMASGVDVTAASLDNAREMLDNAKLKKAKQRSRAKE